MSALSQQPDWPTCDETSKTWRHLPPVFMGERVPAWPADKPIPSRPVNQDDISTIDGRVTHPCSAQHATGASDSGEWSATAPVAVRFSR